MNKNDPDDLMQTEMEKWMKKTNALPSVLLMLCLS